MQARVGPAMISIAAVVIRKDGRREDLGVIAYYHRSWWKRFKHRLRRKVVG